MLAYYVDEVETSRGKIGVTEEEIHTHYLELMANDVTDESQLQYQSDLINMVVQRLIERDYVLVEWRPAPGDDPKQRQLTKHPGFMMDD
jgi:hypothetical protein